MEFLGGLEKFNFPRNQNPPAGGDKFRKPQTFFIFGCGGPPPLAFCQSIIFNLFVGFFGALVKANFPKNINPPAGGNSFFGNVGKTFFLICETPNYDWPCQSLFQKTFGGFLGGLEKE